MYLVPSYAENVIVGIINKNNFAWYITDRDDWILDINKYCEAYSAKGISFDKNYALKFRANIEVIDESTIEDYIILFSQNRVDGVELRDLVYNKKYKNSILELQPSLLIDFDNRRLYSLYPEFIPYEKYIPDGWTGRRQDFLNYISNNDQYWMFDGINLLDKYYEIERNGEFV